MFICNLSIVIELSIFYLLQRNRRKVNNGICSLVFVFEIMFKLFMKIRHRCSDSLSVDPSRVHSNKFSVSWVHLGKLFCDTNLLPFVSCILGSSIILLLLHIQIVSY